MSVIFVCVSCGAKWVPLWMMCELMSGDDEDDDWGDGLGR